MNKSPQSEPAVAIAGREHISMPTGLPFSNVQFSLLFIAVASRLIVFFVFIKPGVYHFSDMGYYADVGEKIFRGSQLDNYETYYMPLGLSYLHASARLAGVDAAVAIPLLNIGLDVLSCLLIWRIAALLGPRSAATWALGAACLYPPFILQSGFMLTETPFLFLNLSAYYWFLNTVRYRRHPFTGGLLSGISFALAVLFKTNLWFFIPTVIVASLIWKSIRCPRFFVIGGICGFIFVNGVVKPAIGSFSLNKTIANAGINLYLGRTYARYLISSDAEKSQWVHNTAPALFFKNKNAPIIVNHSPLDGWFFIKAAGQYVSAHKETVLTYSAEHVLDLLGLVPYWPLVETELAFLDLPLRIAVAVAVILPAFLSICLSFDRQARVLLLLPIVSIVSVSIVFFGSPRYRLPYDGYILILAVAFYRYTLGRRPGAVVQ